MRFIIGALVLVGILLASTAARPTRAQTLTLDRVLAASDWLNAKPTESLLRGKVVLLDFYTFNCFNCQNTEPNLRALYRAKSRLDLVILGVHSPETDVERDRSNVIASLKAQGIVWPVAVDNDFVIWRAYGVQAWPTQMIFDRSGQLRKTIVGDSQDQMVNAAIDQLIAEKP